MGAGVTLEEACKAHETLKAEGINIRVVDPFTLKPIDQALLIECAKATGGLVVTVEDHYDQGNVACTHGMHICRLSSSVIPRIHVHAIVCK